MFGKLNGLGVLEEPEVKDEVLVSIKGGIISTEIMSVKWQSKEMSRRSMKNINWTQ